MRFSRNWIAEYTELPDEDSALADVLSSLGLVVDAMDPRGDDLSLDLDVAANRPDLMNHFEVARELSIATGAELSPPPLPDLEDEPATSELAGLEVDTPAECPRFVACAVVDVQVDASPAWLVERLESIGIRSINTVVDVSNFVMWELGRPMHAYDLDKLAGHRLLVRRARNGERLLTLDEVDRTLTGEDLVIADGERAVGLAGVMGGEETGVTESTRRLLLECAVFDPGTVRGMAKRHGMHTDASHRFERGLSHEGILRATRRAAGLIADLTGGRPAGEVLDVRGEIPEATRLRLPLDRIEKLLGDPVPRERVVEILEALGFGVEEDAEALDLVVPRPRLDIEAPVDVIEEIARFWGYERLPDSLPVLRRSRRHGAERALRREARVRELLVAAGYWEAMTFVFTGAQAQEPLRGDDDEAMVALENPLSEAMGWLRPRLLPGLLTAVARNHNLGTRRVRLFELGRAFTESAGDGPPVERRHLALVASGPAPRRHHAVHSHPYELHDLKGALETLAGRMRWPEIAWETADVAGFQSGSTARVRAGGATGVAGRIDPAAAEAYGIEEPVWAAEIDVEPLLRQPGRDLEIVTPPRYPAAERDLSVIVARSVPWSAIESTVTATARQQELPLEWLELLDLYRDDQLPEGTHVVTLRLTYRSRARTLTADEIDAAQTAVTEGLEAELDARRR